MFQTKWSQLLSQRAAFSVHYIFSFLDQQLQETEEEQKQQKVALVVCLSF